MPWREGVVVPKLKDLLDVLEWIAPSDLAESWDNPGLQVGFLDQGVRRVVLSLDPTTQAVRYALSQKAQVLLTHHPLIFKPISSIKDGEYPGGVVYEAIRGGLSIVALHTNLDAAHEGINAILANLLGLEAVEPLFQSKSEAKIEDKEKVAGQESQTGLGRIGDLPDPIPLEEMILKVKELLGLERVRVVNSKDFTVRRVAVVGGSGGSLIREAWLRGAQVLVTGDVSYHQAREAEFLGLAVIDGGHFSTERVAFKVFSKQLQAEMKKRNWEIDMLYNEEESDPLILM